MISIYWLGLEGDDVRFDEPHATTDKPILSFELNEGWKIIRAYWYKEKYGEGDYLSNNELILINENDKLPWAYRASTVLMWILHTTVNDEEFPPFVKQILYPYQTDLDHNIKVQHLKNQKLVALHGRCECGGFKGL